MKPEASIMPSRDDVVIHPRKVLTRRETIELAVRQGGRCGCLCGQRLDALREGVTDEHVIPLAQGGSNDLENRQLWRTPCAIEKTKSDRSDDAKIKRIRGETCAGPKKAIPTRADAWGPKGQTQWPKRPLGKRPKRQADSGKAGLAGYEVAQLRSEPNTPTEPETHTAGDGK